MFIKICGITTIEDALLAAGLGASAVGLICAASTRRVSAGNATDIVRRLPPDVLSVGVFRNERKERVAEIANRIGVGAVQLHGSNASDSRWIASRVPVLIKAFSASDPELASAGDFGAQHLLIDSATPGSGKTFDWSLLDEQPPNRPFILAGGLDGENVADAIRMVRPWGVDVATGVEATPGHKDPAKLRKFIGRAREAFEAMGERPWQPEAALRPDLPFDWEEK